MNLSSFIHYTKVDLMPDVPLYVYVLKGNHYSIMIDTGIAQMKENITELVNEVPGINNVLITHVHADHIGNNLLVKNLTGAQFYSAGAVSWIEDPETHYLEFCIPSEYLPDSTEQRNEIMGLMDGPVHVDAVINEGLIFRPDDNIELQTIALPGHKLEEVGFLEIFSGTLFMGDVLLALAAPFFHGFQTARGFHKTLLKLEQMINSGSVRQILAAHHPPMDAIASMKCIADTKHFLNEVEEAVLTEAKGVDFPSLWKNVCKKLNRQLEFRGFAMLQVQVDELIEDHKIKLKDNLLFHS